ncbi:IS3 family transposase [Enterococcus faecalis]|uniref:IS3 family transposase n=1 Tax=Enterococcus TaxID=1350 RepID=UPI0004A22BC9|nr:IS3 family transposase [Enterococcus faecalis]EGO2662357.1 IS3 family transposase [Enterococcus faecalis]EGO2744102.1 IS3 family transposase [Enterococcus faecalis]EGO2804178.1 IS3 family transposase [Enterococcus faecalis]EGO2812753.1 IS3 family transposase [Enterococcus faecalis]EGO2823680.1 IS3 family transposase [Enterococcus faecalis]
MKKEEVYTTTYSDFEEANRSLFSYIEGFYNRNRIHSSIHYLTPQEFEDLETEKMSKQSLLKFAQDIERVHNILCKLQNSRINRSSLEERTNEYAL